MNRVLIVAEHVDGKLNAAVAKCVACAAAIPDAEIAIAVFAKDGAAVAAAAAAIAGVARVLLVKNAANEPALAAVLAPQVAKLAEGYGFVLGPSTTFGKDLMPRVAALLGAPQVSDIMAVESATRFRRPVYAANAIATVEAPTGRQIVATVRVASFQAAPAGGPAPVETPALDVKLPQSTRFISVSRPAATARAQTAMRVVSGGRALGSPKFADPVLADARGRHRPSRAVTTGYAPNELRVGQTEDHCAGFYVDRISGAIRT
jgi:electron transfer flavoprotein alpha subunit